MAACLDGGFLARADDEPALPEWFALPGAGVQHQPAGGFGGLDAGFGVSDEESGAVLPGSGALLVSQRRTAEVDTKATRPSRWPCGPDLQTRSPVQRHTGLDGNWRAGAVISANWSVASLRSCCRRVAAGAVDAMALAGVVALTPLAGCRGRRDPAMQCTRCHLAYRKLVPFDAEGRLRVGLSVAWAAMHRPRPDRT